MKEQSIPPMVSVLLKKNQSNSTIYPLEFVVEYKKKHLIY
jgi:hypothetical protein